MSHKKKHILFLAEWFPHPADPQLGVFIEKHARAAAVYNHVTVIHIISENRKSRDLKINLEKKDYSLIRISYKKSFSRITNFFRYRKALKKAISLCDKTDMVHLHVCGRNAIGRKMFLKKLPFVITEHWSGYLRSNANFLVRSSVAKRTFRNARAVSAPSFHLKKVLEKIFSLNDIRVIPNVIEESPRPLMKPVIPRMIAVADMVDEIKNITGILNAIEIINKKTGADFRMQAFFIGSGPDKFILEERSRNIDQEKINIRFTDALPNEQVLEELKQSSFVVVNSNRETFSMITAEALLAGIPVIATRCGGPEELITGDNGILIDIKETDALAEAIIFMHGNHQAFDPEKISKPVREKYSLDAIALKLKDFYQ